MFKVSLFTPDNPINYVICSHKRPPIMDSLLLQEETGVPGVPGENLRCLVESNWTTFLTHMTKVTLIRKLQGIGIEP